MKKIIYGFLGCLLLIAMFLGIQRLTNTKVLTWDGFVTAKQFSENIYNIKETDFRVYDWALYTPEDFAAYGTDLPSGEVPAEYQNSQTGKNISKYYRSDFARFKTDYLELRLEPGKTYGIHVENATYAMKLWVDDALLAENGTVSDTAEGFVPLTRSKTVYFTATDDLTRIVLQRANWVHHYWNTAVIKLGTADLIEAMAEKQLLGVSLTIITLLVIAMINLGMFFYSPKRGSFLFFSLACAFIAVQSAFNDPKPVMLLFPNLNWLFGHRLEHCAGILTGMFLILFYYGVFQKLLPRLLPVITIALAAILVGGHVLLPSLVYTRYSTLFHVVMMGWFLVFFAWNTFGILRHRKSISAFQWATFASEVIYLLSIGFDRLAYGSLETVSVSGIGVVCVAFIQTVALSMDYRQAQEAYETAHSRELELEKMNETLMRLSHVQTAFFENMIHELKSPLAVIASNCGVSTMLIQRGRADEKTVKGLKLAESEAVRLGNLIDRTSKVSFAEGTAVSVKQESVGGLLQDARLFCEPICQKNRNRMEVLCGENDTVYCDRDLILQVLYNLIINANRHTENSTILLVGKTDPDKTVITVSDHGDGIMPDMREKVFERGYSGDGSTGYGLSICRTIMDMHHGDIAILDNEGGGTVVEITIYNERDKGDSNATDTAD